MVHEAQRYIMDPVNEIYKTHFSLTLLGLCVCDLSSPSILTPRRHSYCGCH